VIITAMDMSIIHLAVVDVTHAAIHLLWVALVATIQDAVGLQLF